MQYVPALDGLRALAVGLVVAFHVAPAVVPGGFIGVDVFFVLSGYLITSTILADLRARQFSLREFYLRRVQRLVPNSVVMVGATCVFAVVMLPASIARSVATHGQWTVLNASNFFIWRNVGGYWGDSAATTALLHTWSLAVEEQFYLLYPLVLALSFRRRPLVWIGLAAVLSLCLYVAVGRDHPGAAFYLLPTRAWQPLAGAVLALALQPTVGTRPAGGRGPLGALVGVSGLAAIVIAGFKLSETPLPMGLSGLIPVVAAVAVLFGVHQHGGALEWALSARPITVIPSPRLTRRASEIPQRRG